MLDGNTSTLLTAPKYDIQLNQPRLRVKAMQCCRLQFRARSDSPRIMYTGLAKAESPWSGLGLYASSELTSEWKSFEEEFVAQTDEENALIQFDISESDILIESSSVTLGSLDDCYPS